jgi:hypothetical protein
VWEDENDAYPSVSEESFTPNELLRTKKRKQTETFEHASKVVLRMMRCVSRETERKKEEKRGKKRKVREEKVI